MTYLLFDTALNGPYTFMLLQQAYPRQQSLFHGTRDETLSDVAPYLFEVDGELFEKVTGPLVIFKAVVLIRSNESLEALCTHFRHFIYETIDGRENYFRFWDARVLNRFLAGTATEKASYLMEDIASVSFIDENEQAICISLLNGKWQHKQIGRDELFGARQTPSANIHSPAPAETKTGSSKETSETPAKPRRRFFYDE